MTAEPEKTQEKAQEKVPTAAVAPSVKPEGATSSQDASQTVVD
jgi:hypothetical protein